MDMRNFIAVLTGMVLVVSLGCDGWRGDGTGLEAPDPVKAGPPPSSSETGRFEESAKRIWPFDAAEACRRQKAAAEALGAPMATSVDLGGGVRFELVLVPAGEFEMGNPGAWGMLGGENPVRRVRIARPFWIGRYEVTQEVWQKVMGANPSLFKGARNPVEAVSWSDCQGFLKKLNALAPFPLPPGEGERVRGRFRLPTEAEWEYACRAGSRTQFGFGDDDRELGSQAWYLDNSARKTHPVGEKRSNSWGLYDCHGNVWEWCQDWQGPYAGRADPEEDPIGPAQGAGRVLRGGSWCDIAWFCRSAVRDCASPDLRSGHYGLRVVASPARAP